MGRRDDRLRRFMGFGNRLVSLLCGMQLLAGLTTLLPRPAAAQNLIIGGGGITPQYPHALLRKHPDFDGDGFADLAVGAPSEEVGTVYRAGAMHVIYGAANGGMTSPVRNQLLHRFSGTATGDGFGASQTWGDFNHDGYDDLAVGIPGANGNIGQVYIYHGGPYGLSSGPDEIWSRGYLQGTQKAGDYFGALLAAGDFNHDGFLDLAVLAPNEDTPGNSVIHVIWGSQYGLTRNGSEPIYEGQGVSAMVAGDFTGDGFTDLAVGLGWNTVNGISQAGEVHIHRGYTGGLDPWVSQQINEATIGAPVGIPAQNDWFGFSLAAGDFNHDGISDLAISAGGNGVDNRGKVYVLYGGGLGLKTANALRIDEGGYFIGSLTAGDFNGDGCADLAVGMPQTSVDRHTSAGRINIVNGTPSGMDLATFKNFTESSLGILGGANDGDSFGSALAAADFNNDGRDDLAIGATGEGSNYGAVAVLFGTGSGVTSANAGSLVAADVLSDTKYYTTFGVLAGHGGWWFQ